jgi:hypothetical protein
MGKDTELRETVEEIVESKDSKGALKAFSAYLWKNVFPIMILGLFGLGTSNHMGMSSDVSDAHERVSDVQFEHAYRMTGIEADVEWKFKWAQEVVARSAAEDAGIRKLLEEAQIALGIMQYRLNRIEKEMRGEIPVFGGPPAAGDPDPKRPAQAPIDYNEIVKRIQEQLGKRSKVNPEDIDRYLHEQRPVQAPNLPRPVRKGAPRK